MVFIPPRNRVLEASTSNSQSVFALTGAVDPSFNRFNAFMSAGDTTVGAVVEPGVAFRSGVLTYTNTNEITVSTVFESKGAFSASGVKQIFMDLPAGLAFPKRNRIVNSAMQVSQENGATAGTTTGYYPVDQFSVNFSNGGAISAAQVASRTPGGSPNRLRVSVTTADTALAAGDFLMVRQFVEGLRVADLAFGTTSAKTITLQFGVKAPAGTYCVALRNGAANRSYVGQYTIAAGEANTDVVKSLTLTGDTAGTWAIENTAGLEIVWCLMAGATLQTSAGAWAAGSLIGTSSQFNLMGTVGNAFELFDVGLYEGSAAPPFQVPDFTTELNLCMRYWEKTYDYNVAPGTATINGAAYVAFQTTAAAFNTAQQGQSFAYKAPKRAAPTVTFYAPLSGAQGFGSDFVGNTNAAAASANIGFNSVRWLVAPVAANNVLSIATQMTFNARM